MPRRKGTARNSKVKRARIEEAESEPGASNPGPSGPGPSEPGPGRPEPGGPGPEGPGPAGQRMFPPPGRTIKLPASEAHIEELKTKLLNYDRSCDPDYDLVAHIDRKGKVRCQLFAIKQVVSNRQFTIPFCEDYLEEVWPLKCAVHRSNIGECQFEIQRRYAFETLQQAERARIDADEAVEMEQEEQ